VVLRSEPAACFAMVSESVAPSILTCALVGVWRFLGCSNCCHNRSPRLHCCLSVIFSECLQNRSTVSFLVSARLDGAAVTKLAWLNSMELTLVLNCSASSLTMLRTAAAWQAQAVRVQAMRYAAATSVPVQPLFDTFHDSQLPSMLQRCYSAQCFEQSPPLLSPLHTAISAHCCVDFAWEANPLQVCRLLHSHRCSLAPLLRTHCFSSVHPNVSHGLLNFAALSADSPSKPFPTI
jgi:hypothetical protein